MIQINNTIISTKSKTKTRPFLRLKSINLSSFLLSTMIIVVMILILVNPTRYAESVIGGLKLFFTAVLPGLLPFMFLCKILTELNLFSKLAKPLNSPMQKIFGINGYGFYAFLMSIISGYPLGSKITADLYKQGKISDSQVTKTAIISSTSGLEFIIGAVGGLLFNSPFIGLLIYLSNILAALTASFLLNLFSKKTTTDKKPAQINTNTTTHKNNILSIITSSAIDTCSSLLTVGFYIAIFSLVIDLLTDIKFIYFLSYPLKLLGTSLSNVNYSGIISGLIEMTNGIKLLSTSPSEISISLASMLVSFSGISIIMQSFSFLSNTPIKKCQFLLGKTFQMILSFIICFILCSLFL